MTTADYNCDVEKIAGFIEGDLEPGERLLVEQHVAECKSCAVELKSQQSFMCELESVLANSSDLSVPANFAKVVAVRAESDMRGLRDSSEHKKAFRLCVILALAAFALLGVASFKAIFINATSVINKVFAMLGLVGKAAYDVFTGFAVIMRVLSGGLIEDSRFAGWTALLLVALAIGLLTLLISRYHRTRLSD
ncbi:MAG TPA: zf-HC2 domain-containing protein [Pyrinomonadaceae bacterium]|nr:zf-HC2 domain-containing protein [Pyrinomonadaceae bacterium]